MSDRDAPAVDSSNTNLDPTFRQYNAQQATTYSNYRASYSQDLRDEIFRYHASNNSQCTLDVLLDVGCGPGNATRDLAGYFTNAVGLDPSTQMIARAKEIGGVTKSGQRIRFEVVAAEELDTTESVAGGSVDILTAAMAAHWFRMDEFWPQAAKMLKLGATVALWTKSSLYCHPSTPNASAVQRILTGLEDKLRAVYELPSNRLSRDMYADLPLPWNIEPPTLSFAPNRFVRREWNRDGKLEAGESDFFGGSNETSLAGLAKALGTSSMVTRWREANPELAGTREDCVEVALGEVAKAMSEEGLDGTRPNSGDERNLTIRVGAATVLLLFTRV